MGPGTCLASAGKPPGQRSKRHRELVEVDIMEYEKKEKALDIIGDNISEGILVVDQSGHITYSSKKARRSWNFTR